MKLPNEITAWDYYYDKHKKDMKYDCSAHASVVIEYKSYIQFIKQPLHPSQFIVWDMENDCPLEKPKNYEAYLADYDMGVGYNPKKCKQYQQALDKKIFEGFELYEDTMLMHETCVIRKSDQIIINISNRTISDIMQFKVHIKDNVAKQLKLM